MVSVMTGDVVAVRAGAMVGSGGGGVAVGGRGVAVGRGVDVASGNAVVDAPGAGVGVVVSATSIQGVGVGDGSLWVGARVGAAVGAVVVGGLGVAVRAVAGGVVVPAMAITRGVGVMVAAVVCAARAGSCSVSSSSAPSIAAAMPNVTRTVIWSGQDVCRGRGTIATPPLSVLQLPAGVRRFCVEGDRDAAGGAVSRSLSRGSASGAGNSRRTRDFGPAQRAWGRAIVTAPYDVRAPLAIRVPRCARTRRLSLLEAEESPLIRALV